MNVVIEGPEVKTKRQGEFVLVDGEAAVQDLGYLTQKVYRIFWASSAQIAAKIAEIQDDGWMLEGTPAPTAIYPPMDFYNVDITVHKYSST